MRNYVNFNKGWRFSKTAQVPETLPDWEEVTLPHTWNAADGQDGGNDYWRGTACYAKLFAMPERTPGQREYLEFNGAAMTADVYVNGHHLAHHEGAILPSDVRSPMCWRKSIWSASRWTTPKMTGCIPKRRTLHFTADFIGM